MPACAGRDIVQPFLLGRILTVDIFKSRLKHMARIATPTIETTKDFILIKIPRAMFRGEVRHEKISALEHGLAQSLQQTQQGELRGPFTTAKDFLRALKKPLQ